jgi:O-antigen/teichoic acid export membrane protein
MSTASRAIKNALALSGAELFSKALNFVFIAVLARQLTPNDFGGYITITSLLALFGALADLGVSQIIVREVAADHSQAGRLLVNGLLVTGTASLLAGVLLTGVAYLGNYAAELRPLMLLATLAVVGNTLTLTAGSLLRGLERMEIPALLNSGILFVASACGIILALIGAGIAAQITVNVIGSFASAGVILWVIRWRFVSLEFAAVDFSLCRFLLRKALPVEVLIAYSVLLRWSDTLILGQVRPMSDVATYATAQKVIDLAIIFNSAAAGALFPMLSSRWKQSPDATRELYVNSLRFFASFGVAATCLMFFLAQPICVLLFGKTYISAAQPLQWLAVAFFFQVLSGPTGTLLVATGEHLKKIIIPTGLVVVGNIIFNWLLAPQWGYMGTAGVFVVTSIATFSIRQWAMNAYFNHPPRIEVLVWRPLMAGIGMAMILFFAGQKYLFLSTVTGILAFLGILWLNGELENEPYKHFWLMGYQRLAQRGKSDKQKDIER